MIRHVLSVAVSCLVLAATSGYAHAQYQYRGMAPGWPNQAAGNYAAYYAPAYGQPMYYVARPAVGAYANPAYFGGYNAAPVTAQRPVTAAYYAPQTGTSYYYAPTTVQYAPSNSYSVSPAGASSAGAEAYYHYGQPAAVNYVPPRFTYRTTYAQMPVYMYRPVTVYQPGSGQPVTCLQPATTTQCQTQRQRWFGHSWFNWGRSCGSGGCAPATTTYCNYPQCGQPYYPAQPGADIPTVPAPGTIYTPLPPAGSTVSPPPTRFPGTLPADRRPSLTPDSGFGPRTGAPSTTVPSFQTDPLGTPGGAFGPSPATPINPGTGGFGSGTNYAPAIDPYSNSSASTAPIRAGQLQTESARPTIQEPSGPTLAPGVQTVPDPQRQPARPSNRAPQLLDPRDQTAQRNSVASHRDQRWTVVPAVWPKPQTSEQVASPYLAAQERAHHAPAPQTASAAEYDESGWTSARW